MADQDTTHYRTNSATFELSNKLKDKTMHMFTLSDEGPSDFSIVISHADLQPGEKLEDFGERLSVEMRRALPGFALKALTERALDGEPAIELAYSWRNDGHTMYQRQVIAVTPSVADDSSRAMLIAATCLKPFNDEWDSIFDATIASMKLRKGPNGNAADASARPERVVIPDYVFVLSERRRTLRVFRNQSEACRNTDAREVEQNAWAFFDGTGTRLFPKFVVPNTGTILRKAGSYLLESRPDLPPESLYDCLHRAAILQNHAAGAPFASIGDIQAYLAGQKAE